MALWEANRDITLDELRVALAGLGLSVANSTLHPVLRAPRHHAENNTGHAIEQDRPDILKQRRDWFDGQCDLAPERLIFIDVTWTATNMPPGHGRVPKGERLRMGFPHGQRKMTTLVAGLRMIAPMVLDGPINGDCSRLMSARCSSPN